MGIYFDKKTRRQFLLGSGKSLLALPLLPSLIPRASWAQATSAPRRMMIFRFDHNNLTAMWPDPARATTSIGNDGSREIMMRALGTVASHSPALDNNRYESLKNSNLMTMIRGLDYASGGAHGNSYLAAGQDAEADSSFPTLDTVMEASNTLYPAASTPISVRKAIRINSAGNTRFFRKVGNSVEAVPFYRSHDIQSFYNEVFGSLTGGTVPNVDLTNQLKSNILNRVFESFSTFRNGTKISSDDRARLDQHMDYLSDLQRGLASTNTAPPITCNRPADPGDINSDTNRPLIYRTYMDLMAVAFTCGITKFGVMDFESHDPQWIPGLGTQGNGFHACMHGDHGANLQLSTKLHWWRYFSDMIADRFLAPLQQMEGNTGRSYLDNMITALICQGGFVSPGTGGGHNGFDSNHILIGSMGGRLRAGRFMTMPRSQTGNTPYRAHNLPYNCFLITLLNLMGVPPSEYAFATPNGQGFGYYGNFNNSQWDYVRHRFYQPISELLT